MLNNPLTIFAVLLGVICVSLHLVDRYQWAKRVSVIMLIIFISAFCSNVVLIPTDAPLYNSIINVVVPFAVGVILWTISWAWPTSYVC